MKHTNLKHLEEISDGSNEFIIEMLTLFIEEMPAELDKIDLHLQNKDWKSLKQVIHKIKSSITCVGLKEIESTVKDAEDYATNETNLEKLPGMVLKIKQICNEAIGELTIYLKELS